MTSHLLRERSKALAPFMLSAIVGLTFAASCGGETDNANASDGGAYDGSVPDAPPRLEAPSPTSKCEYPMMACGGTDAGCVNTSYDAKFCGACNTACAPGESCIEQRCTRSVFAVRRIFLGDTDRLGNESPDAWKEYGANLDTLVSPSAGGQECKPAAGAPASTREDGTGGIDNAWGKSVLPLFGSFDPMPSKTVTDAIEIGGRTPLIAVASGIDHGTISYTPVFSTFGFAESTPTPPTWDGTDVRRVAHEWTIDGTSMGASFEKGTFEGGTAFDSGRSPKPVLFAIPLGGTFLEVPIHALRIRFTLVEDDTGASSGATDGVISGYVVAKDLADALAKAAGRLSPDLCGGSTVEGIQQAIRQAADILVDGTQDPNKECDAISIGLGFEAVRVINGEFAPKSEPAADLCGP